jgi:hypothetical protein
MLSNAQPGDAIVYARLVAEAGLRRDLAAHAERIAASGERRTSPDHAARLAGALRARASLDASGVDDSDRRTPVARGLNSSDEDKALAVLIQNREIFPEVRDWLTSDCFPPGMPRDIYEAATAVFDRGEPVNELTVAWQLARDTHRTDDAVFGYLKLVGAMPVEPIEGFQACYDLLVAVTRAECAAIEAEMSQASETTAPSPETHHLVRRPTFGADLPAPELLQPPQTPPLGPDGPQIRW